MGAAKVVRLSLPGVQPITAPAPSGIVQVSSTPAPSAGFWSGASSGEKVAIVGGGALTAALLYLAFKPGTSRRRRRS